MEFGVTSANTFPIDVCLLLVVYSGKSSLERILLTSFGQDAFLQVADG